MWTQKLAQKGSVRDGECLWSYSVKVIFNADKTVLYDDMLPDKSQCLHLRASMTATIKYTLIILGVAKQSGCFKER